MLGRPRSGTKRHEIAGAPTKEAVCQIVARDASGKSALAGDLDQPHRLGVDALGSLVDEWRLEPHSEPRCPCRVEGPSVRRPVEVEVQLDVACVGAHTSVVATLVFGSYEWDEDKAAANLEKHGISFVEAASALQDPHAAYVDASTAREERTAAIGLSAPLRRAGRA
jgi:hypothetical protein